MENTSEKAAADSNANSEANPRPDNNNNNNGNPSDGDDAANRNRRTPFTDLSQVDADLALARTLQEQERAYMMLRMDRGEGSDYGSWETGSYEHDEEVEGDDDNYDDASEEDYNGSDVEVDSDGGDAVDEHGEGVEDDQNVELDPSAFSSDEAYARALQDAEDRQMAARLLALAGINELVVAEDEDEEEEEEHSGHSQTNNKTRFQDISSINLNNRLHESDLSLALARKLSKDVWEEVDPDELSYEELVALGEVVGTQSRGLSSETICALPSINYKSQGIEEGSGDSCVICRLDYEDGDTLTVLSCKHTYHPECINNWLQINKVCPVCSAEVSTSGKA